MQTSNGAKKRGREETTTEMSEGAFDFYEKQEGDDAADTRGYQESIQYHYQQQQSDMLLLQQDQPPPQQQYQSEYPSQQYPMFFEQPVKQEFQPPPFSTSPEEAAQAILGLNFQPNPPQGWKVETTSEAN